MSKKTKTLNDVAWEQLFEHFDILNIIDRDGRFEITATEIKKISNREARLMAKFDHKINLPKIFADNNLSILPLTRGNYVISHFEAFYQFESSNSEINQVPLPSYIQSLDVNNITSETVALNCAVATGIIAEFLQDEDLVPTVSGRMGSGTFDFKIINSKINQPCEVTVNKAQIEIDAAYEGVQGLALFEVKRDLAEDFLIRQLYYPFKAWKNRVSKPVRTIFLVYSNGIYRFFEYKFQDENDYNSLVLINQKNYTVEEDIEIKTTDIENILKRVKIKAEPKVPFPQADRFERVINICELLNEVILNRHEITEQYAFDARQTNYYTDAARYLGLLKQTVQGRPPAYCLSDEGKKTLNLSYKQRQLAYCELILSQRPFKEVLQKYFDTGEFPTNDEIIDIMKNSNLYNVKAESTFKRRASTVRGWVNWIIDLITEDI